MVVVFVCDVLVFYVKDWDEESYFLVLMMCKVVEFGFGGIYVCEDVGGLVLICFDVVVIFEELFCGCIFIVVYFLIYNMVVWIIDSYGFEVLC